MRVPVRFIQLFLSVAVTTAISAFAFASDIDLSGDPGLLDSDASASAAELPDQALFNSSAPVIYRNATSASIVREVLDQAAEVVDAGPGQPFETLQSAIDHFAKAEKVRPSITTPCVIRLGPGRYEGKFTLPDYVSLIGSGPNETVVTGGGFGSIADPSIHTVDLGEESLLANLSVLNTSAEQFGDSAIAVAAMDKLHGAIVNCYIDNWSGDVFGRDAVYISSAPYGVFRIQDTIVSSASDCVSVQCVGGGLSFFALRNEIRGDHHCNSIMYWLCSSSVGRGARTPNRFHLFDNNATVPKTRHSPLLAFLVELHDGNIPSVLYAAGNTQKNSIYKDNALVLCHSGGDTIVVSDNDWKKLGGDPDTQFVRLERREVEQLSANAFGDCLRESASASLNKMLGSIIGRAIQSLPVDLISRIQY
jgi:hypothetical protein